MTLFWGILFLIFILIEFLTINLVTIWFACACVISLFFSIFIDSILIQVLIFILSSIICLIFTKNVVNKIKIKKIVPTNSDRYIGKRGDVIKKITPKENGEVKVLGVIWTALSDETLDVGDAIVVQGIEGVKLIVKKEEK